MAPAGQAASISPRLVTALDHAWSAIRARHPDVPEVVITIGSGSAGPRRNGLKLGHYATARWQRGDSQLAELFIGGEGMQLGAREMLGTLLHEAAHGVADTRQIRDTSRQDRFHNTRFRELAGELGLEVARTGTGGWSETSVPDVTVALYRAEVRRLEAAMVAFRHAELRGRGSSNNGVAARCDCGRRIRVSQPVLAAGPITCGVCNTEFEVAA